MLFLTSHVVFQKNVPIYGPIHVIAQYAKEKNIKTIQIYAPLSNHGNYIYINRSHIQKTKKQINNVITKYLYDLWYFTQKVVSYMPKKKDIVISADPLSSFIFAVLKKFVNFKFIYYTVDYADQRFSNEIFEKIYRLLDELCMKTCDENWCVSQRIVDIRKQSGYETKAKFVPNTNISANLPSTQKQQYKNKLIYVGRMENNMNIKKLINAFVKLRSEQKNAKLTLIGGGQEEKNIIKIIEKHNLEKHISYMGPQPNNVVQKQIKKHGIGIALYSDGDNWNRYGDSMKIREYQQYGLPVITTDIPANADEIKQKKAGIILSSKSINEQKITKAIKQLQNNYKTFTQNAVNIAEDNQKIKILNKLLANHIA